MSVTIWDDPDFQKVDEDAQRLYLMLVSFVTLDNAGVLPMTLRRWARCGPNLGPGDVLDLLRKLVDARFVFIDEDTEEVLVRTFIRNDEVIKQPQIMKSALRAALGLSSPFLRQMLAVELRRLGRDDASATAQKLDPRPDYTPPPPPSAQPASTVPAPSRQPAGSLNGVVTAPARPSESAGPQSPIQAQRSLPAPCADPGGEGGGEGGGEVVRELEGVARAREGATTPPTPIRSTTPRGDALCGTHPDDDRPCRLCRDVRLSQPPKLAGPWS